MPGLPRRYRLEDHNKRLKEVLQRLRKTNLKLQPDKCKFLRKEVIYLGHIISENGISRPPDPSKLIAVKEFPTPKEVKDIQSFIGLAGYYRKFIENFSKIAKPLTKLTKKIRKVRMDNKAAFELLKQKLMTVPVLKYPDHARIYSDHRCFRLCDRSSVITRKGRHDRPIAYASRILTKAKQNYNTTKKKLLAIVWAV